MRRIRPLDAVQRRLSQVHVSGLNQRTHKAEEQSQQQSRNVLTVHIRIRHQNNLVVTSLLNIEVITNTGTESGNHRLNFSIRQGTI